MFFRKPLQSQPQTRPKPNLPPLSSLQGLLKQDTPKTRREEVKIDNKMTALPRIKAINENIKSPNTSKTPSCLSSALIIKSITHMSLSENKIMTRFKEIRLTSQVTATHNSMTQKEKNAAPIGNKAAFTPSSKPKNSSHNELKDHKKVAPAEQSKIIELEPCIAQVSVRNEPSGQVRRFDDAQELYGFANSLLGCRITRLRIFYSISGLGLMANDIQITYKNVATGEIFEIKGSKGDFNSFSSSTITLADGEFIEYAETANGQYLKVRTNKGKINFVGHLGKSTPDVFAIGDNVVVGAYGSGYGVSGLGFYIAPRSEVSYHWRRPYILMKAWLAKNKEIIDQLEQDRQEGKMKQLSLAAQTFFIVATLMDKQTYRYILKYI